jgi:hypothetical protein
MLRLTLMALNTHYPSLRNFFRKAADNRLIQAVLLLVVLAAAMSWIQFSTPNLPDNDGYYHIRFASLMRDEGLKPKFPYLPLTILNTREFYDHHFLFHVALIPFTFGDLRIGAKWAAVVFASLAIFAIWDLFFSQGVAYSGLWTIGIIAVSESFLYRMSIPRAQSFSLLFLVLGFNWLLKKKNKLLAVLAFFYVWLYDAFALLAILAFVYLIGVWLIERRVEWRPLAWVLAGTALGLLLNPYFPHDIIFIFRHLFPKLMEPTAINVGSEWYPYDTKQLVENSGISLLAFMMGVLALGLRGEKMEVRTAVSLLTAMMFGFLLLQSRRFVEYFPPFAVIFCGFAWQPFFCATRTQSGLNSYSIDSGSPFIAQDVGTNSRLKIFSKKWMAVIFLTLIILFGMVINLPKARASIRTAKPYSQFAGASNWLMKNTPAGGLIFQTDWDDFPRLFYYNTHNTYLIGLDPTYMLQYNGPLYHFWTRVTEGNVGNLSKEIPRNFNSYYIVSDLKHQKFIEQALRDPLIRQVYRDNNSVVFEISRE